MNTPGHNNPPDDARRVTERMAADYAEMVSNADVLVASVSSLPLAIRSKEDLGLVSTAIVNMRDAAQRAEATRVAEKEPYLRSGQAVDAFFKGIADKLTRAATDLNRRVNDYQQAILAAERRRRDEEAREAARVAEEARQKAERARTEANKVTRQVEATLAERRADEALEATQATPAGMVRERFDDGRLVTMKKVRFVEVVDFKVIPLEQLRAYLKPSAIEDALKRWAVATEYSQTMPGVRVGERDDSVVR